MMLKNLKRILKSEKNNKDVFDIIIYGSVMKGEIKPSDIDIMIIFLQGSLSDRLNRLQKIKSKTKKAMDFKIDLKQMLLKDFFSPGFFARTGILLEGFSLFNNKSFSETLGFKSFSIFSYTLEGLTHNEKIKIGYILKGRNTEGMIQQLKGKRLGSGAIKIPIENSIEFEEILQKNNIKYKKHNILEES